MSKSITITLEDDRVSRAEALAAARGMTLNEYIDRLLEVVTAPARSREDLPPVTRSAVGILTGVPDKSYKEVVEDAILEKYGSDK